MNTEELITGIIATRSEMSVATRRDCDAIYRRLLPRHQAAWDELSIPNFWLTAGIQQIRDRITKAGEAENTEAGA